MKILTDQNLRRFEFWSGGADRADVLTDEQMDRVEEQLEMLYPDGIDDGELNDLFWFESDWIAELLGFDSFEQLERYNTEGEKFTVQFDDDRYDDTCSFSFDSEEDATAFADNEMETTPEYQEYIQDLEPGTGIDIWICSSIHDEDSYCYKTLYTEEEEDDEE